MKKIIILLIAILFMSCQTTQKRNANNIERLSSKMSSALDKIETMQKFIDGVKIIYYKTPFLDWDKEHQDDYNSYLKKLEKLEKEYRALSSKYSNAIKGIKQENAFNKKKT